MKQRKEIFTALKTHHLRLTKTRKALIELFFLCETPLSAQDILRELCEARRAVNKTTVYRELERLQKIGIIGTVQLGDRKQYYELVASEHHHHLVCLKCEKVENIVLDEKKLKEEAKRAAAVKNFLTLRHSLEFFGLCKMCN
ncbi:MAG: Fur family transcriptional regulator [bacterium]|nr:Fur family transcriptional regulator [bacterium]